MSAYNVTLRIIGRPTGQHLETFTVDAPDELKARRIALVEASAAGYRVRDILRCEREKEGASHGT